MKKSIGFYLSAIKNSVLANTISATMGLAIANALLVSFVTSSLSFSSLGMAILSGGFILSASLALLDIVISEFYAYQAPPMTAMTGGYVSCSPLIGGAVTHTAVLPLLFCSVLGAAVIYIIGKLSGDDFVEEVKHEEQAVSASL